MKQETFVKLIESCETELKRIETRDKALEQIFGGDTQIIAYEPFLENVVDSIIVEYGQEHKELLNDFVFRIKERNPALPYLYIDNTEYEDTIENLWLYLEGKL